MPSCKDYVPVLSESLDRELSLYKKIIVKLHLATCPACVRYLKQIRFVREASQRCGKNILETEPDVRLSDETRERLKNILKDSAIALGIFSNL